MPHFGPGGRSPLTSGRCRRTSGRRHRITQRKMPSCGRQFDRCHSLVEAGHSPVAGPPVPAASTVSRGNSPAIASELDVGDLARAGCGVAARGEGSIAGIRQSGAAPHHKAGPPHGSNLQLRLPASSSPAPMTIAPTPAHTGMLTVSLSFTDISIGPTFASCVSLV